MRRAHTLHRETHFTDSLWDDVKHELGLNDAEDERLLGEARFGGGRSRGGYSVRGRERKPLFGQTTRYDVGAYRQSAQREQAATERAQEREVLKGLGEAVERLTSRMEAQGGDQGDEGGVWG